MRPEQRADSTDDAENVATAAGRNQPAGHDDEAVTSTREPEPAHRGKPDPIAERDEARAEVEERDSAVVERDEEPAEPPDDTEAAPRVGQDEEPVRLLRPDDGDRFHARWQEIQARFVDDPRDAVRDAGALLDEALASLTDAFNEHKRQDSGAQTEDLRLTLRRYRSVLNRLLDA